MAGLGAAVRGGRAGPTSATASTPATSRCPSTSARTSTRPRTSAPARPRSPSCRPSGWSPKPPSCTCRPEDPGVRRHGRPRRGVRARPRPHRARHADPGRHRLGPLRRRPRALPGRPAGLPRLRARRRGGRDGARRDRHRDRHARRRPRLVDRPPGPPPHGGRGPVPHREGSSNLGDAVGVRAGRHRRASACHSGCVLTPLALGRGLPGVDGALLAPSGLGRAVVRRRTAAAAGASRPRRGRGSWRR